MKHNLKLGDLTRAALERLLQDALLEGDDDVKDRASKLATKEREDLADLHDEKGDSKAPEVDDDDLPEPFRKSADEDEEEDDEDEDKEENTRDERVKSPFTDKKKKSPMKGEKPSFPFKKKGG